MFSRATIVSRPVIASAAIVGTGVTAYYITRPNPVKFDSAMSVKTEAGAAAAQKKTFSSAIWSKELKVAKVEQVNHDTKRITFQLPSEDEVSGISPSAAVLTQHTPAGAWFPVLRPYTPVHDLEERGTLQLLVKKYPNGRASTYMHSLEPGSTLLVRGPLPGYGWKPSATPRDILLVAGGAGITPLYSLAKGILKNPEDKTKIELVWGVNGSRDIVLKKELEQLEGQYPGRLRVTYAVSGSEAKPEAPSLGDEDKYRKGYVNSALLKEVIQRCEKGSFGDEKGTKIFLCGPPAMEEAVAGKKGWGFSAGTRGILAELGLETTKVYRF